MLSQGPARPRPTFYLHFKTKADLLTELAVDVRGKVVDFNRRLRAAVAAGDRASVREYLDAAFDFWEEIREFALAEEEAATLEPDIRQARNTSFDQAVASIVAGLKDAGRWTPAGRRVRAVLPTRSFRPCSTAGCGSGGTSTASKASRS